MRTLYYIAYPHRMAGANRSLFALISHLPRDVSPVVALIKDGEVADRYRRAGIDTRIVPPPKALRQYGQAMLRWSSARRAWEGARSLLPYTLAIRKLLKKCSVDLVHVNDVRGALLTAGAARLTGCPIVGHVRGEMPLPALPRRIFERACDRIITVSNSVQSSVSQKARRKCRTVYNGIDRDEIVSLAEQAPPDPILQALRDQGKVIVCCFASVVPFKGIHHLVEATARLNARGWGHRLSVVVVGDLVPEYADYQTWLRNLQRELAVHNMYFAGWQANPFPYYQAADFTVLPSVSYERLDCGTTALEVRGGEGLPRTHLEAMCFGLPVVGTGIAGVPEIVTDGQDGLIVPPSAPAALADAMERLLADEALRNELGARARQKSADAFSMEQYVAGVRAVYESLLSRPTAPETSVPPSEWPCGP